MGCIPVVGSSGLCARACCVHLHALAAGCGVAPQQAKGRGILRSFGVVVVSCLATTKSDLHHLLPLDVWAGQEEALTPPKHHCCQSTGPGKRQSFLLPRFVAGACGGSLKNWPRGAGARESFLFAMVCRGSQGVMALPHNKSRGVSFCLAPPSACSTWSLDMLHLLSVVH